MIDSENLKFSSLIEVRKTGDQKGLHLRRKSIVEPDANSRCIHFIVDQLIILSLLYVIVTYSLLSANWYLYFTLTFLYYFVTETTLQKTFSKYLTGSSIIDEYGNSPSIKTIFLRSLIRIFPLDLLSVCHDRLWHDKWTKTYLIRKKELTYLLNLRDRNIASLQKKDPIRSEDALRKANKKRIRRSMINMINKEQAKTKLIKDVDYFFLTEKGVSIEPPKQKEVFHQSSQFPLLISGLFLPCIIMVTQNYYTNDLSLHDYLISLGIFSAVMLFFWINYIYFSSTLILDHQGITLYIGKRIKEHITWENCAFAYFLKEYDHRSKLNSLNLVLKDYNGKDTTISLRHVFKEPHEKFGKIIYYWLKVHEDA